MGALKARWPGVTPKRLVAGVGALVGVLLALSLLRQSGMGLADNGDWARSMGLLSSGPLGLADPGAGGEAFRQRYFVYWIPIFELDGPHWLPATSLHVLQLPGALLSWLFAPPGVLDLRFVGVAPRLLSVLTLGLVAHALERRVVGWRSALLCAAAVVCLGLVLEDSDYVAYFNTFYQDAASLAFLPVMLIAYAAYWRRPASTARLAGLLVAMTLLATTRASSVVWPIAVLGSVGLGWGVRSMGRPGGRGLLLLCGVALAVWMSLSAPKSQLRHANAFNAMFDGALLFSDEPRQALSRIGLASRADLIGEHAHGERGLASLARDTPIRHFDVLRVLLAEPAIAWRMLGSAARAAQDVSLEYLGLCASGDEACPVTGADCPPSAVATEVARCRDASRDTSFGHWSAFKYHLLPRGGLLLLVVPLWAGWFAFCLSRGRQREAASIGLLCIVGCAGELAVAVFGNGMYELTKHLVMANFAFDLSIVAGLVSAAPETGPVPT